MCVPCGFLICLHENKWDFTSGWPRRTWGNFKICLTVLWESDHRWRIVDSSLQSQTQMWKWDVITKRRAKTSVCTWTHGGSETSLNTVVHENVKVYTNQYLCEFFFWNFLKFFQKLLSAHTFINCTNVSKFVNFVNTVFNPYSNFIKLSNISKIFSQASTKLKFFYISKVYTNSFTIYPSFLNIFSIILKFPWSFLEYSSNCFSNFQRILLKINKLIPFLNFAVFSWHFLSPLLTFYQVLFCKFLKFFFKDYVCSNFILVYLKIFLQFSKVI